MLIEVTTIGDLIDTGAARHERDAVVFPQARATYAELSAASERWARSLRGLGVGPREHVGILMHNRLEYVVALLAIAKLGAVGVPINGRFKVTELSHVCAHGDLVAVLTCSEPVGTRYPDLLSETFPDLEGQDPHALRLAEAPLLRHMVDVGEGHPGFLDRAAFEAGADTVDPAEVATLQERVRVRDVALLMYTSGTTAKPKGCLISHEAIVRHAHNSVLVAYELSDADRLWDPLPLFHCGALTLLFGCLGVGATFVHSGHFDAGRALAMMERERCTAGYPAFETIWTAVLDHPDFAGTDLSAFRIVLNVATPERLAYYQRRTPDTTVVSGYGSTEGCANLILGRPDQSYEERINTVGRPVPGMEVKAVDPETREERSPDVVGELASRGYCMFEGYYKDPEHTAATHDDEGWFYSGDLISIGADGLIRYAGRLKDMLKVGGENVAAVEVEDWIARLDAVTIVSVVGADDERYGEVPAAFVQRAEGAKLSEQDVIDHCAGKIAAYKVPRYVRFVEGDDWPMSGTKIQKFVLREQLAAELSASAAV